MILKWRVWDFPDNIRVYFSDEFRNWLFKRLKEICGSRYKLAKILDLHPMTIKEYELGHDTYGRGVYISVKVVKQITQLFLKELGTDFLNKLESNIIAYRSRGGLSVKNPVLPIKESPEFYSIVFHIICDGCDSEKNMPYYCNLPEELLDEFIKELQIFGNVKIKRTLDHGVVYIHFPKVITKVLSSILNVKFTRPENLPNRIFEATDECKIAAIRAFADDEGCISHAFYITQKSKYILLQLKRILKQIGIKTGKISETTERVHRFVILKESYETYLKKVGFTDKKKLEKLTSEVERIKLRRDTNKKRVMNFLSTESDLTKYEIANKLDMPITKTFNALVELRKDGELIPKRIPNTRQFLWGIKE